MEIIIMTAYASQKTAIAVLKAGAFNYLIKLFEMDELALRIKRFFLLKKWQEENLTLRFRVDEHLSFF